MELPRSLFCLTLAHSIDDKDVVEQLLTDFPEETTQCLPIALRTVLEVDYLPPVPFFSDRELLRYLSLLWSDQTLNRKLFGVASNSLIYLVAYYLDRETDIHANHDDALILAATYGHTDTVGLLLDRKADIHSADDGALRWAAYYGHTETVKLLLDRKADIHARYDDALRDAAARGRTDTVKLLLDRKADIHSDDDFALRYAVRNGHIETVKLLLDRKSDIHAEDDALRWATRNGHIETVQLLRRYLS
jgi:ankyrin repeat protein